MFSLLVVFNSKKILDDLFLKSFSKFSTENKVQLILIDNTKNRFKSSSEALNYGIEQVVYDFVFFCHQDIYFYDLNFFTDSINFLINNPKSIVGSAGALKGHVFSNISQGKGADFDYAGIQIYSTKEVQTLDECLFGCNKDVALTLRFDEFTIRNWHLYATDLCLTASYEGIKSYVIPANIYHASKGKIDKLYYSALKLVLKKHLKLTTGISTTCAYIIGNNHFERKISFNFILFKYFLKNLLKIRT